MGKLKRQYLVNEALHTARQELVVGGSPIADENPGDYLQAGADALVAFIEYELGRRTRARQAGHGQGVPEWSEKQWAGYHEQQKLVARIPSDDRRTLANAVAAGALTTQDVRDFMLSGPFVTPSPMIRRG